MFCVLGISYHRTTSCLLLGSCQERETTMKNNFFPWQINQCCYGQHGRKEFLGMCKPEWRFIKYIQGFSMGVIFFCRNMGKIRAETWTARWDEIGRLGKWVKKEGRFLQKLSILNKAGSLVGFRYQCLGRLIWMLSRENIWPCVVSTVYVLACVLFVSTPCITRGEKQMFRGPDSSHPNLAKIGWGGSWPKHSHFH